MSDDGNDESRAGRLRNRRQRTRNRTSKQEQSPAEEIDETDKPDEPAETSEPSKPSKQSEVSKSNDGSGASSVKDEQVGTYMYLPESLTEELAYQFKIQSAEYEREIGTAIEKNRHWYPLLLSLGLEQAKEMDPEEMQSRLAPEGSE